MEDGTPLNICLPMTKIYGVEQIFVTSGSLTSTSRGILWCVASIRGRSLECRGMMSQYKSEEAQSMTWHGTSRRIGTSSSRRWTLMTVNCLPCQVGRHITLTPRQPSKVSGAIKSSQCWVNENTHKMSKKCWWTTWSNNNTTKSTWTKAWWR